MLSVKKLLCPTDFSEPSYKGIKAASIMAKHFAAELIVAYVIKPMPTYSSPGFESVVGGTSHFNVAEYLKEIEGEAKKSLDRVLEEMVPDSIASRSAILHGEAAEEIVDLAREEKVDAIVIATHGYTGFRHFISGSVAEKVVRLATCPVLTIPAHDHKKEDR